MTSEKKDYYKRFIDHTALNPETKKETIRRYAQEVKDNNLRGICVRSENIIIAYKELKDTFYKISSVVGFPTEKPLSSLEEMISNIEKSLDKNISIKENKKREIDYAISLGANEIDMIIDLEAAKRGDYSAIEKDVADLKRYIPKNINLKVIECAPYFNDNKLKEITKAVVYGGGDFVKTTTGFGKRGASLRDVKIFAETLNEIDPKGKIGIKAAGGIKNKEQAEKFYKESQKYTQRPFIIGASSYPLN